MRREDSSISFSICDDSIHYYSFLLMREDIYSSSYLKELHHEQAIARCAAGRQLRLHHRPA